VKSLLLAFLVLAALMPTVGFAGKSDPFVSNAVEARFVTAQNGVVNGAGSISGGLYIKLAEGWKTYWRTPGEVGTPPTIDWAESENIANVDFLWPAPLRFRAFGIENFGYKNEVLFPLNITLETPGAPARLQGQVRMLTCSIVCVPQDFTLSLQLDRSGDIDVESATLIAEWSDRVPVGGAASGIEIETAAMINDGGEALVISARSAVPFKSPDVFPEFAEIATFGPADVRLGDSGRLLWAQIPVTSREADDLDITITITDRNRAATVPVVSLLEEPAAPPYELKFGQTTAWQLVRMGFIAFLGGLILNIMPCVLPVLSIKLTSAIKARQQSLGRIRSGFLMSAAGVMVFMWGLAAITLTARTLGLTVGWGLQFQSPMFLTAMIVVLFLFAANLFGLYEFRLPQGVTSRLANASGQPTYAGDFATGSFAAILATPCSAPLLGTAVAFALAGRPIDIFLIFSALGLGLALPYLLVAARPKMIYALPKPGRWMLWAKAILGGLLAATTIWLLWVLDGVAGRQIASAVFVLMLFVIILLAVKHLKTPIMNTGRLVLIGVLTIAALAVPAIRNVEDSITSVSAGEKALINWVAFDRASIARRVSEGFVVFVDVTADWCLTCKANKVLVIERGDVARLLNSDKVIAMQADWTRPSDVISRFLEANGRYGIPFNAVFGPEAPEGILLPEVLTQSAVLDAIARAGGPSVSDLQDEEVPGEQVSM